MTTPAPIYRVNVSEKSNSSEILSNKTENLSNIVVMRGSAKRRRLQTEEKPGVNVIQKDSRRGNFKDGFLKLRAPSCKSHQKQGQTEERFMTKSCEILFECIKPYKEIRVSRSQVTESRTFGSILGTNIIYETTATRKVQFFSFPESRQNLLPFSQRPAQMTTSSLYSEQTGNESQNFYKVELEGNEPGKTVSSEDFITNVF